jgi:cytochrome c biogenesis protein CcdA/peroxiredoxin
MSRNVAIESAQSNQKSAVAARAGLILHGLMFVLGFTVVFVSIGLMTTAFVRVIGGSVTLLTTVIGRVGGIVIIIFGLHFMGVLRNLFRWLKKRPDIYGTPLFTAGILVVLIPLIFWGFYAPIVALPVLAGLVLFIVLSGGFTEPDTFWLRLMNTIELALYSDTRREMDAKQGSSLGGSFLMGVIFSAGWTPCIGPFLGTILTVAAQTGDVGVAMPMLTAYSLGLGIPFLLTAGLLEGAQRVLRSLQRHMHKIELASGFLLVIIGILVATGGLASISQNLTPEQIDFSVRIEECGLGFFKGELTFTQAQSCLGGSLRPVAFNQSLIGAVRPDAPEITYVVQLEEATIVDVELNRLDEPFAGTFSLLDKDGQILATGSELTLIEEDRYLALQAVELAAGTYTIIVNGNGADVSFRVRIRETEQLETSTTGATDSLTGVASIEALAQQSPAPIGLAIGERAPDFAVNSLDGDLIQLSELRGKVVLVNFWGTWCGPCIREMPELQALYDQQTENFTIIALATEPDTEELVRNFQAEMGITFPLALDSGNAVNDIYGITSQPSTFILDQEGVILYKHFGAITQEQISEVLAELPINS